MTGRVALTGGSGFVGAAIIDRLLENGFALSALARDPRRLKRAGDVDVVKGGLSHAPALDRLADGATIFIHCAGLTHARRDAEFTAVNVEGARLAARAARVAGAKFILISSLAARAPHLSAYAASKRAGECFAEEAGEWLALRAPAMYGPGDAATLPYFRMIKRGLAPEPATEPVPRASILFVSDFADAVLAAFDAPAGVVYEVGDDRPDGYTWREIGAACAAAMKTDARPLRLPGWAMHGVAGPASAIARLFGGAPMVTPGKVREFFHPDWAARDNLFIEAAGWRPATPLEEGFAKTARWYQENGLL
ncbi:MAG: NAD-dependent epimerase/dehydratase family protein [Parvularculaceae bacterium]